MQCLSHFLLRIITKWTLENSLNYDHRNTASVGFNSPIQSLYSAENEYFIFTPGFVSLHLGLWSGYPFRVLPSYHSKFNSLLTVQTIGGSIFNTNTLPKALNWLLVLRHCLKRHNSMRSEWGAGVEFQNGLEKSAGKENSQEMTRKIHQSPTKSDVGIPNLQTLSFSISWLWTPMNFLSRVLLVTFGTDQK